MVNLWKCHSPSGPVLETSEIYLLLHQALSVWGFEFLGRACRDFTPGPRTLPQTRHFFWTLDPFGYRVTAADFFVRLLKYHAVPKEIFHWGSHPVGHPAESLWSEGWHGDGALPTSFLAWDDPGSHLSSNPDAVPQPPQQPRGRSWPAPQECRPGQFFHSSKVARLGPLSGQTTGRKTTLSQLLKVL